MQIVNDRTILAPMQNYRVPQKPSVKRMSQNSHTWTILTYAKVLKYPFDHTAITEINPIKYPRGSRNIGDTLRTLKGMGLVKLLDDGRYQITQDGIDAVYWFGNQFVRNSRNKSDLGD